MQNIIALAGAGKATCNAAFTGVITTVSLKSKSEGAYSRCPFNKSTKINFLWS